MNKLGGTIFLMLLLMSLGIGINVCAQDINMESEAVAAKEEEFDTPEVQMSPQLNITGTPLYSQFFQGRVNWSANNLFLIVCNGLKLEVHNADGGKEEYSYWEWEEKGVVPIVKNKSTGTLIALDQRKAAVGVYELSGKYQGATVKICEFRVRSLEESVDQLLTTEKEVNYGKAEKYNRNTVTKFVPKMDGSYTFSVETTEATQYLNIYIRDKEGNTLHYKNGANVSGNLKAGESYYITTIFDGAYTLSARVAEFSKAIINGEQLHSRFFFRNVSLDPESVCQKVCNGLELEIQYTNGEKTNYGHWDWTKLGVTFKLKSKDTGEELKLSGYVSIPIGNYELSINYKGQSIKAVDFEIVPIGDMAEQTITTAAPVHYEKSQDLNRITVTKFIPEADGQYTFSVKTEADTTYLSMSIWDKDGNKGSSSSQGSTEFKTYLLGGEAYYLAAFFGEGHTIEVNGVAITSKKVVNVPSKIICKSAEIDTTEKLMLGFLKKLELKVGYADGTDEKFTLFEANGKPGLGLDLRWWLKDVADANSQEKLGQGSYNYQIWLTADTSGAPAAHMPVYIYDGYNDVAAGAWFHDYVAIVSAEKIMTGLDKTTFGPVQNLARAQFALILYRMNGEPEVTYKNVFKDVPDGTWYTDAVIWASDTGIVNGYSDTKLFGTSDNINREQMAVMMYRYAKYQKYDTSMKADFSKFKDAASVNGFAKEAMQWAVGTGIISGKDNGTIIDPQGNASRSECATIITRFIDKYPK